VPEKNDNDEPLKFYLSPNDLVYVPTEEETLASHTSINADRIYKFMDSSGNTANFVPHRISSLIYNVDKKSAEAYCRGKLVQNELGLGSPQLKNQRAISGEMIKSICWKLEVDRLGNVVNIQK
jgi:CRISPR-associated endonuclease Csn1